MAKTCSLLFFVLSLSSPILSQTGPAGVGTNTVSICQNRFWLKADVGVFNDAGTTLASNGNLVQQWNDQSGVANNAIQATSGRRPRYVSNAINGFPAMRFIGTSYVTASALPGIANNVGYTYLIVFKDTSFTAGSIGDGVGDYIIDRGAPSTEGNELSSLKICSTNKYGLQKRDGTGSGLGGPISITSVNTANYHIIDYRQIPGANKTYELYLDGAFESSLINNDANYTPQTPQIGHHYQSALGGIKGYIAEVILYNYNVNNAQLYILNSYLAAKYGLALTSNDKYNGDTPANGNYDFEVAGIGREASASAINTESASSISGGLRVSQGATPLENNEYLVYGHQSGANSMNFTDIVGMSAGTWVGRWERIWYFDFSHSAAGSTSETLDLTFDISDGGMGATTAATATNYKLLYRAGLTGNWTEIAITPTISGDRITFAGLAYNTHGNGYYTVGTLDNAISPLPIELLNFNAKVNNNKVDVNWTTASEFNNDYFTIYKSKNGINFDQIAIVDGAGNSTSTNNYSIVDNTPFEGLSYYRLKQTDINGEYSFSNIEQVEFSNQEFSFNVFPNPNSGNTIFFSLYSEAGENTTAVFYDVTGKVVFSSQFTSEKTGNEFYEIDTPYGLPNGIYIIKITSNQNTFFEKMIFK
jgi:hypothetical protein